MSTEHNISLELHTRKHEGLDDDLIDALSGYGPVVGLGPCGWVALDFTIPATGLRQAVTTALALVETVTDIPVLSIQVMPTDEFDARNGLAPLPQTIGVPEAAQLLDISVQAVHKRLSVGTLPVHREGRDWRIQRAAVARLVPRQE